jgi:WD40 repeat protein
MQAWITSVQWIDDQNMIATQSEGLLLRPGSVVRLAAQQPETLNSVAQAEASLWSVLSIGDQTLVSDYKGRILRLDNQALQPLEVQARWIRKLVAAPGGSGEVLAGTEDGQLIVLSPAPYRESRRVEMAKVAIFDVVASPSATQIAVAMGDGSIQLRSWPELELQLTISGKSFACWALQYTSNGQRLISGGADRKLRMWDVATGAPIVSLATTSDWITSLVRLPETDLLIAGCLSGALVLVDDGTMLPVKTETVAGSGVWGMDLSPDGKRLAVATRRNAVVVVELSEWLSQAQAARQIALAQQPPQP